MITLLKVLGREDLDRILAWLTAEVKPNLTLDVSSYAKARQRAWIGSEPNLKYPEQVKAAIPLDSLQKEYLEDLIEWKFDWLLATYSGKEGTGILPHRDASYANFEARSLNVSGTCRFEYWCGRMDFGQSPSTKEFNPLHEAPTHTFNLRPGDVLRFNCKNLHSAAPSADRWNLNFWQKKTNKE